MKIVTITNEIDKYIFKLDAENQARVLRVLDLLEKYENKLTLPYSKSLRGRLFELRIGGSKNIRIIYCFYENIIYLLNIFSKKTNKISKKEIDLAIKRFKILA